MLIATILHAPFGTRVARVNDARALAVPGVRRVVRIAPRDNPTELREGVAVLADNTWAAFEGRRALDVVWSEPAGDDATSSDARDARFARRSSVRAIAFATMATSMPRSRSAARTLDVVYEIPFLAHVPMEPVNYTADVRGDRVELWGPTQDPGDAQATRRGGRRCAAGERDRAHGALGRRVRPAPHGRLRGGGGVPVEGGRARR